MVPGRTNRKGSNAMIDRRSLIKNSGAAIAALGAGMASSSLRAFAATVSLPFDNGERPLVKYPQKRPMIGLTSQAAATGNAVLDLQRRRDHAEQCVLRAL